VADTVFKMLDSFHSIFRALNQISKPVVAVVDGPALGGGCELVAACDIVICSERARFGQPEIKLGCFRRWPRLSCRGSSARKSSRNDLARRNPRG
jgi:enoyl-CoA hydratase/carnithine racemase